MGVVEFERRGAVMQVTLNRPPVNALSRDLVDGLAAAVAATAADPGVAVFHIRSAAKAFCAGADLNDMRAAFDGGADGQIAFVSRLQQVFQSIEDLTAVSIAEIGGAALGGGMEMALACDLRVIAREAKVGLPEVNLGLIPGAGGTQRMTALCGVAVAKRLILGAEAVDGDTAVALGLAQWAVPREELAGFATALADRIAGLPTAALAEAKRCIAARLDPAADGYRVELEATRRLLDEAETRRRVAAFLSRGR